ncbi:MAG: hypothetical protein J7K14_07835 [Sulfurimonas sp.]|nr:hypothetical protein [Sulfurimonas sp.]
MISIINNTINLVNRLQEVSKNINEIEFKNLLADISNSLADAKLEVISVKEELVKAKERNQILESEIKKLTSGVNSMLLVGDIYVKDGEGQYCTTCWDSDEKAIRIQEEIPDFQIITGHKYICPICSSKYKGK